MPSIVRCWEVIESFFARPAAAHSCRKNATRSCFSPFDSFNSSTKLKNSTVSSRVRQRPSVQVRRAILDAAKRKALDRAVACLTVRESACSCKSCIWLSRKNARRVADRALRLAEDQLLAAKLALGRFLRVEAAQRGQLGAGGKSRMFCIWAMCDTWMRSRMFIPFLKA